MASSKRKAVFRTIIGAIALIVAGSYLFFVVRGPHGVPMVLEKRREIRELEQRNADLEGELQRKRERIGKLQKDRSELELEIRRRHKLLKKNETTFVIQGETK